MVNSALIRLLSSLNPGEFREFSRFVNSPVHNGRKVVTRFFSVIKKYYPGFTRNSFTAESVFSELYPGKKYDSSSIRRLSSFTLKLLESYLAYVEIRNDPFYFDIALAIQYSRRGLYKNSERKTKIIDKKYKDQKGDYEFYFWKRYLIERHKNSLYAYTGNDHLASESIIRRTDYFSYHIAVVICKSLVSLCINEKNFNTDYSKSDFYLIVKNLNLDNYINNLSKTENDYYSILSAEYYQSMALLNPGSDEYFGNFKKIIKSGLLQFSYIEQLNFYSIFEAVCTLKIESGQNEFSNDLFEAYNLMLDKGLYSYTEGGEFILRIFRNIVHTAIMTKKNEWLEEFLSRYLVKVPAESRENMGRLAEAMLLFEKGEYGDSLKTLSKIDYELFHFKIDIKNLQLKIFYELNYFSELEALIDAYRHFITNNKFISIRYNQSCTGFVNNVQKLLKVKQTGEKADIAELESEILNTPGAMYQNWLVDKLKEFLPA